jgi:hypothetical protein
MAAISARGAAGNFNNYLSKKLLIELRTTGRI